MSEEDIEKAYGDETNHPCYGCVSLHWDGIELSHGMWINVPLCELTYLLAIRKCADFDQE